MSTAGRLALIERLCDVPAVDADPPINDCLGAPTYLQAATWAAHQVSDLELCAAGVYGVVGNLYDPKRCIGYLARISDRIGMAVNALQKYYKFRCDFEVPLIDEYFTFILAICPPDSPVALCAALAWVTRFSGLSSIAHASGPVERRRQLLIDVIGRPDIPAKVKAQAYFYQAREFVDNVHLQKHLLNESARLDLAFAPPRVLLASLAGADADAELLDLCLGALQARPKSSIVALFFIEYFNSRGVGLANRVMLQVMAAVSNTNKYFDILVNIAERHRLFLASHWSIRRHICYDRHGPGNRLLAALFMGLNRLTETGVLAPGHASAWEDAIEGWEIPLPEFGYYSSFHNPRCLISVDDIGPHETWCLAGFLPLSMRNRDLSRGQQCRIHGRNNSCAYKNLYRKWM